VLPFWRTVRANRANLISSATFITIILVALLWPHNWSDVFVTGGIAPLLAMVIVCFTRTSGWLAKTMGTPLFNKLGEASYAVYILQVPVWHYWQQFTNNMRRVTVDTGVVATWQVGAFVPFLILVALATHRFVESPLHGWLRTRGDGRSGRDATATVQCPVAAPEAV